jgi:hypothetical protein
VSAVVADSLAQRAEHLLGLWSALSMQHVALGAGCACGAGGISLRLDDFEPDIVDYLEDAGLRSGFGEVVAFFDARRAEQAEGPSFGRRLGGRAAGPLVRLLEEVQQERLPGAVAEWLLPKLEHTLNSYAEQHGPRAG